MLPNALAVGMTYKEFMHSTPKIIHAYFEAYKIKQNMIDEILWQNGLYTKKAFEVVMSAFGAEMAGKTSHEKYFEKPFSQEIEEKSKPKHKESNEECAVFEMKQRINLLRQSGLPESPM